MEQNTNGVMMIRVAGMLFISVFIMLVTACSNDDSPEQPQNEQSESEGTSESSETENDTANSDEEMKVVAENLDEPWEIARANDKFYVSERTGSIVTIRDDQQTRKPVQFSRDLSNQPEAGLLGMALPDDFEQTKEAIAYYSYEENNTYYQRVAIVKESDEAWEESTTLLDEIPGGRVHQGGRIEIGPDNKLYITTGDATNPEVSQELGSLAGKILRMNLDGSIPDDNPFDNSYVYSYGHRNSQGLAWNDENDLYATEHGSDAHDEMNRIEPGNNYGWPVIRGDETADDMVSPILHSGEDTWAPSGMTYHNESFYFASLAGEAIHRFDPENETETQIVSDQGRTRDVLSTEEGIYFLTNNTDGRGAPAENDDRLLFIPNSQLK